MKANLEFARDVYCAITQTSWTHPTKGESGFSYRGAEWAAHKITGIYFGFYMEDNSGLVTKEIEAPLRRLGWHWKPC